MTTSQLDNYGPLTSFDYEFLLGVWDGPPGAAYNVVADWCVKHGFGLYGAPTERGLEAMGKYEQATS